MGWRAPTVAILLAMMAALCLAPAAATAALTFPALSGRVVDDAHVLSPQVQTALTQKLADLQTRTSRQLVVVTLPSLQGDDIADYGYQLGRSWGIGQKGLNNGALFIVAPTEHKVRIEVGYGLEPILTDALTSQILQEAVLPKFRAGDISGGVVAGSDRLIGQLGADASTAEQKAADAERSQAARAQTPSAGHSPGLFGLIIPIVFVIFVLSGIFRGGRGGGFLPGSLLGGLLGGMRGGDDDDNDGGGGGGGGFSGGGGSFGGGGSSGELVMLKPGDHRRIADAIAAAEAKTSGEIFCIVTGEVSKYREVPIAWGAAAALIIPPALLVVGLHPWSLPLTGSGWTQAPNLGDAVTQSLTVYAIAQALIFALVAFLVAIPAVRRVATPRFLKRHRVRRTAYAHFASTGLAQTSARTGVLIFASLEDRQVELVADEAIHRQVGEQAWNASVAALIIGVRSGDPASGFIRAISLCGDALCEHFPLSGVHAPHGDGVIEF